MPDKEKNAIISETDFLKRNVIELDAEEIAAHKQEFLKMPSSAIFKDTLSALANANALGELPEAREKVRSKAYLVHSAQGSEDKIISAYIKTDLQYSIALTDFSETFKKANNKGLLKIYVFVLTQIYEQCFQDNKLIELPPDVVQPVFISFDKMAEIGVYTSKNTARDGFSKNYKKLMDLKYGGKVTKGKPGEFISLFKGGFPQRNGYALILNDLIDWNAIAQFYAEIPAWIFKLNTIAFQIALYIFYLARQNTKEITENHSFTISLRAIKGQLALPDEKATTDPKRVIKEPIENAIEEINQEANSSNFHIELTPKFSGRERISDYLDRGRLKITIQGEYSLSYEKINTHTKNRIEANKKRQNKPKKDNA